MFRYVCEIDLISYTINCIIYYFNWRDIKIISATQSTV